MQKYYILDVFYTNKLLKSESIFEYDVFLVSMLRIKLF